MMEFKNYGLKICNTLSRQKLYHVILYDTFLQFDGTSFDYFD